MAAEAWPASQPAWPASQQPEVAISAYTVPLKKKSTVPAGWLARPPQTDDFFKDHVYAEMAKSLVYKWS